MAPSLVETRAFLAAINDSSVSPRRVPPLLHLIAAQVVRRADRDAVDDLVQAALLDLVERSRKHQAGGVRELLALDAVHLHATLRRRFLQVAATSAGDRWKLIKLVRERVRAALTAPPLPAVALPLAVTRLDRIDMSLLRQAVSWYRAQPENKGCDPKQIPAWIVTEFFPGPSGSDLVSLSEQRSRAFDDVEERLDAPKINADLRARLADQELRVLANRAKGATLKEIAASQECAVSTVHARVQVAIGRIRQHVQQHGLARQSLEAVLHVLA